MSNRMLLRRTLALILGSAMMGGAGIGFAFDMGNMMNPSRWMGGNSGPGGYSGGPGGYGGGPSDFGGGRVATAVVRVATVAVRAAATNRRAAMTSNIELPPSATRVTSIPRR